jgi:hypothetical protein
LQNITVLFQIGLPEIGHHREVDVSRHEGRAVLAEPEAFQPLHDRFHETLARSGRYRNVGSWIVASK